MNYIGIDVHRKESQICIVGAGGELVEQRIRTSPERFAAATSATHRGRASSSGPRRRASAWPGAWKGSATRSSPPIRALGP
jgi:hypothetical protein